MPENGNREGRILDAAADLMVHYGYDKTTVDDIARAAGVSKGAIYLHFKGKEELFERLLLREADVLTDKMIALWDDSNRPLSLFTLYTDSLMIVAESPLLKAIYTQDRRVLGDFLRRLRKLPLYGKGFSFGLEFVRNLQTAGLVRKDVRPEVVAYIMMTIRAGIFLVEDLVEMDNPPPLNEVAPVLAEMMQKALAPQGESDQETARQALLAMIEYARQVVRQRRPDDQG